MEAGPRRRRLRPGGRQPVAPALEAGSPEMRPGQMRSADALADEALVAGMAAGDEGAGAAFVRRHQRRVFGIALAITMDRGTAEDVAQEALLRAWRHAAVFDPRRAAVTSWLATITRNLSIDALRVRRAVPAGPDDAVWLGLQDGLPSEPIPETAAVHADAIGRVRAALLSVPVEQRRALVRSAFYGQSAAEIAAAEDIALGTAKSRVRLGLARVRDTLGGVGGLGGPNPVGGGER